MVFFAILRSIPYKAGGILSMGGSIIVLFLLPFIYFSEVRNTTYRPIFKFFFWLFVSDFVILIWLGQKPVEDTYVTAGQIATVYYFSFLE